MTQNVPDEYQARIEKLKKIRSAGMKPYPDRFAKAKPVAAVLTLKLGTKNISTAGRLLTIREMGKICFCHLQDATGRLQLVLRSDEVGPGRFRQFLKQFDPGDFVGVTGELFKTNKGEVSLLVKTYVMLGKALRPLPEKWHGLKDQESRYRQRYLDLVANPGTYQRFLFRSRLIKTLREFYWSHGFVEVETPILTNTASGAIARPFTTHYQALDLDVYLRIAPETYLKECIIGGFEKVFEIGRCFRNEGMDPSHLQDFTMAEHYAAYWNYEDNIAFTEMLFSHLLKQLLGSLKVEIKNRDGALAKIDFAPPWPRVSLRDRIKKDCGIDIDACKTADALRRAIKAKKVLLNDITTLERGNLIDALYKTVSRDKIVQPTLVTQQPIDVSPLARRNDKNPAVVDQFQLVVNGWEILKAYSELVDPVDQKQRFDAQAKARSAGDHEAHTKDDEYVRALEHGAPPISGWGMGVDRLTALLTQQDNLRDVVLFPLLKPESK